MAAAVSLDVVVLAGGASRRMGADKARLQVGGRRLVDLVAEAQRGTGHRVLVACGDRPLGLPDEVADADGLTGPIAGLLGALRASTADAIALVPVDAPHPSAALPDLLHDLCRDRGRPAAVPVVDGHVQSLHAVLRHDALAAVERRVAAGERSPRRLLGWLDALRVDADAWGEVDPAGAFAQDWDRPEDVPGSVRIPGRDGT